MPACCSGRSVADLIHGDHDRRGNQSKAWQSRNTNKLEELPEHRQTKASQHSSPAAKGSGERKGPTFHTPRPGTICVLPDHHLCSFE